MDSGKSYQTGYESWANYLAGLIIATAPMILIVTLHGLTLI
jgi:hypothetical protein